VDQSRFGWFREYDIEILNAMAVPYGDTRDPIEIETDKGWIGFKNHFNSIINGRYSEFEMVMIGVMLGLLFILVGMLTHSLTYLLTHLLTLTDSLTYSLLLTYSLTHSLTYSFTHSLKGWYAVISD